MTDDQKTDEVGTFPAAACSPECDTCHHWEYDDGRHGYMSGYCPIFQKVTHKDDGGKCTAWEKIHLENDQAQGMATPQGTWTMSDQNKRETGDGNGHDSGHSLPLLVRPKMAFTYIAHVSRTRFEFKPITMVWGTIIVDKTTIDEDTWEVIAEECQEYTSEFPSYIGEMNPALRQCQCKEFSRFLQKWSNSGNQRHF